MRAGRMVLMPVTQNGNSRPPPAILHVLKQYDYHSKLLSTYYFGHVTRPTLPISFAGEACAPVHFLASSVLQFALSSKALGEPCANCAATPS